MKFSIIRRSLVLLILMYYAALSYASDTLLVLGDSLSAGYKLQENESWVTLLADMLQADHYDIRVVNASVSGATSTDGLNAFPKLLVDYKPSILILALGSNDGLRGSSLQVLKNNLGTIITKAKDADCQVLLVGFKVPPNYGKAYADAFAEVFPELSKKYDVPLVPFLLAGFETDLTYFQKDKLHPLATAQPIILQNVWLYLKPMLKDD